MIFTHCDLTGFHGKIEILDDEERYIKMAMKIDSKDPALLKRNENNLQSFEIHFPGVIKGRGVCNF